MKENNKYEASKLLKTVDDFKIWDRLMTDLTKSYDVPKKQIMINWDIFYSKWFSKEVDIKELQSCFSNIVKEIK